MSLFSLGHANDLVGHVPIQGHPAQGHTRLGQGHTRAGQGHIQGLALGAEGRGVDPVRGRFFLSGFSGAHKNDTV